MASSRKVRIAQIDSEPWELDLPVEDGYPSFRDLQWSATFGSVQSRLAQSGFEQVWLSFSELGWADPLPLLGLITSIRGAVEQSDKRLVVDLGSAPTGPRRGAFLRFLAEHWFLRAFWQPGEFGRVSFTFDGRVFATEQEFFQLEHTLERSGYSLTYDKALCLRARVVRVPNESEPPLTEVTKVARVSSCLDEIRDYGLRPLFAARPELIDALVYKLRVILYELFENAVEHAFDGLNGVGAVRYFGVYARVRRHVSESERQSRSNKARSREDAGCPTLNRFNSTSVDDWIELFYYDDGRGLLADIQTWAQRAQDAGNNSVAEAIGRIKPSSNKLGEISKHFFGAALSRFGREGRTALTGLQHVGLVLATEHDFARACVAREWIGAVHPWKDNTSPGSVNLGKLNEFRPHSDTRGTAWHFCIRVRADEVVLPDHWAVLSLELRQQVTKKSLPAVDAKQYSEWHIIDERELSEHSRLIDLKNASFKGTVVWLPGDARKQRVYQWLTALKGRDDVAQWLIADIPAYQAALIAEVLCYERSRPAFPIFLITDDWRCANLCEENERKSSFSSRGARRFLLERCGQLFCALRAHDSELFWDGIPSDPRKDSLEDVPFVYEKVVDWEGSNGSTATLDGYLELTQALTSPRRSAVCKRAIARTWHLYFPRTRCEAADTLLAGLLPEASLIREHNGAAETTLVSSVLVTGATAERNKTRGYGGTIHLFRHAHVVFEGDLSTVGLVLPQESETPIALGWMGHPPVLFDPPDGKLPYQRIPGTPFIGRGGPKAIPIRRFEPPEGLGESANAFVTSFYGETPGDMYEHFLRLGILKIGHWRYEGHHDLFTVNLAKAYALERIDQGPLVKWLVDTFQQFRKRGARILIYPSHRVTDHIVRDICGRYPDVLPRHVIPVHFLAQHTQSSIRIPSLTYDRIREVISTEFETEREAPVVLFDDGTITGKVAREMEHLIRNAGATRINTVTLINRTGLPLYRKLLMREKAAGQRKHFWRWDVPALGNRRTCPLCRAVEQAKTVANSMPKGAARDRMEEWYLQWELGDVVADWEKHGLSPGGLPKDRPMTFGKEWLPDRTVLKHEVTHTSTTGLASMVIEVMRTTTYKAVGLKVADDPAGEKEVIPVVDTAIWDRARLEILASQVLLFFDDLDKFELAERLSRILNILFRRLERREIDALAGLTILLADSENAELIFRGIVETLRKHSINSLDGKLALGHILGAARIDFVEQREPDQDTTWTADEIATYRENLAYAWRAYAQRKNDPANTQRMSILTLVLLLGDTPNTTHCGFLRRRTVHSGYADLMRVIGDLETLEDALQQISPLLYQAAEKLLFQPASEASRIGKYVRRLRDVCKEPQETPGRKEVIDELHNDLFGNEGIASAFQSDFILSGEGLASYLNLEGRHDEVRREWERDVLEKSQSNPRVRDRWETSHGFRFPEIVVEMEPEIGKLTILAPALVRQVLWESMKNVIHSPAPLLREENVGRTDIFVQVRRDKREVVVMFRMLACEHGQVPDKKTNGELMLSLLGNTVEHKLYSDGTRWLLDTEVRMLTVSGLGGMAL